MLLIFTAIDDPVDRDLARLRQVQRDRWSRRNTKDVLEYLWIERSCWTFDLVRQTADLRSSATATASTHIDVLTSRSRIAAVPVEEAPSCASSELHGHLWSLWSSQELGLRGRLTVPARARPDGAGPVRGASSGHVQRSLWYCRVRGQQRPLERSTLPSRATARSTRV